MLIQMILLSRLLGRFRRLPSSPVLPLQACIESHDLHALQDFCRKHPYHAEGALQLEAVLRDQGQVRTDLRRTAIWEEMAAQSISERGSMR